MRGILISLLSTRGFVRIGVNDHGKGFGGASMGSKWVLNSERCKGCDLCTSVCPVDIVYLSDTMNRKGYRTVQVTDEEKCISCGFCAMMCPDVAIEVYRPEKEAKK